MPAEIRAALDLERASLQGKRASKAVKLIASDLWLFYSSWNCMLMPLFSTESLLSPIIAHFKSTKKTYMAMMNSVPFTGRLLKLYVS